MAQKLKGQQSEMVFGLFSPFLFEKKNNFCSLLIINRGIFWIFKKCTLFNSPSSGALRFRYVGGCWDRTKDCYDIGICSKKTL